MKKKYKRLLKFIIFFTSACFCCYIFLYQISKNVDFYTTPAELKNLEPTKVKNFFKLGARINKIESCDFFCEDCICTILNLKDKNSDSINTLLVSSLNVLIKKDKDAIFSTKVECKKTKEEVFNIIKEVFFYENKTNLQNFIKNNKIFYKKTRQVLHIYIK